MFRATLGSERVRHRERMILLPEFFGSWHNIAITPTSPIGGPFRVVGVNACYRPLYYSQRNLKRTTTIMSETTGSAPQVAGLKRHLFRVCRVASSIERPALPTN